MKSSSASSSKSVLPRQQGETVRMVTKDLVRNLRIPCKDPSGPSIVLPPTEFEHITSSLQLSIEEKKKALKEVCGRMKDEELRAAEEKKRQMYEVDMSHKKNRVVTVLELEAQEHAQRLLEYTDELRMEQEDEIKKLNKLILGVQCQSIRDAQIREKRQIQGALSEEEKRLDAMMEEERRKTLERMDHIDELRKQQRISGMQQIYNQIQQRLEDKQLQDELKEIEKHQIREKLERMKMEDQMALEKKREEQQLLHQEVMSINAATMRAKEQRQEEERLADMREMEYMRSKLKREAEYEMEQRRIKKEKELEIARLRAQQEKARDYKAEQDELRARRNQEATEREWRRKEKERAAKRAQEEEQLRAARCEQVQGRERALSMEASREKAEFERALRVQQEATLKEEREKEKQRQKALRHTEAIKQQVKERERLAIAKRSETFREADRLIEEARQRRMRLEEIKQKKMKELKATGLCDKYCSEVEKKAQACLL